MGQDRERRKETLEKQQVNYNKWNWELIEPISRCASYLHMRLTSETKSTALNDS